MYWIRNVFPVDQSHVKTRQQWYIANFARSHASRSPRRLFH